MIKREKAQVVVIFAVLLMVVMLLLAVIIDGARLMLKRQELTRVASAAGKAGLIVVGDQMVTQVVKAQTEVAMVTLTPQPTGVLLGPTPTPIPAEDDFFGWINDTQRAILVGTQMRTMVATNVKGYAEVNGLGLSNSDVSEVEIIYPYQYYPGDQNLQISVRIEHIFVAVFRSLLEIEDGTISGRSKQNIPQR